MNKILAVVLISRTIIVLGRGIHNDEPQCFSRFDHDFKVVKKLAELESELEKQQKAIENLAKERDDGIGRCAIDKKVAFSAYLTSDMASVPDHSIIIFDEVQTNVGNAYNGKSGIFVCGSPGVYVFYWVVTNKDRTYMESVFMVNGEERSQVFSDAGNHNDYAVASNVVVTELKSGDQVWIRAGKWHNGKLGGQRRTSFSGWKLYD